MSRRRQLYNKLVGQENLWLTGLLMQNIPAIMLENSFIRGLCAAANAALYQCLLENEAALSRFDISKNM